MFTPARSSAGSPSSRCVLLFAAAAAAVAVAACGDEPAPPTDAGFFDGAPGDASDDAASGRDAGPPFDPASYDCRAVSTPPSRVSPVALACVVDGTCAERLASSHRGAGGPSALAPENTLSALRAAIAAGADFVEGDVRVSADGIAVLMHDDTVERTTDGSGAVSALTLAQLQALALDVATSSRGDFSCEQVPTLADALALADDRVVYILDGSKLDDPVPIIAGIRAAGALDRVVYDDTNTTRIRAAITLEPALHIALRATTPAELETVLTAFADHPPIYVHIEDADPAVMAPLVAAAGHRVFALGFLADLTAPRSSAAYDALYGAGIDIVQSNRIELLGRSLGRR